MNRELPQYRLARIEGYRITRARLEQQFSDRAIDVQEVEEAVAAEIKAESLCAPWRRSEIERAGCREGVRRAALEFLFEPYRIMQMAAHSLSA